MAMKKKLKVLYVAATQNKKHDCFDGEVLKSDAIKHILQRHFKVTVINLTEHRLLRMIKLIFLLIFKRYNRYIVSKSTLGANKILSIFRFFRIKKEKIIYFVIGSSIPGYIRVGKVDINNFKHTGHIVVETEFLKTELHKWELDNVSVLHNFKTFHTLDKIEKHYPKKVLKLCFLSRVVYDKGIVDIMKTIKEINQEKTLYQLDIYGKYYDDGCIDEIHTLEDENMKYLGIIPLKSKEDYAKLQHYDLHAFPTRHLGEGVPGSVIDFLMMDIPTISSKFKNYQETMDDSTAFLYEYENNDALKDLLIYIYNHQEEIEKKSKAISKIVYEFSEEYFEKELLRIMGEEDNGSK